MDQTQSRDDELIAKALPAATQQAGALAATLLMDQLSQKIAANEVLAWHLQDANHKAAMLQDERVKLNETVAKLTAEADKRRKEVLAAEAKNEVVYEALCAILGFPVVPNLAPSFEKLLDAVRSNEKERAELAEKIDQLQARLAPAADDAQTAPDWGVVVRLRAVLGHMKGNRVPSAIGLLESVIDELISSVEPPAPENEDELAEATAADLKIKENKENP
jgi:hypothetical protein